MKSQKFTVKYRRKRQGKTNYKKRLAYIKSGNPRLVIRSSLNNILVQCIEFNPNGDKILVSSHSSELEKYGWKNIRSNLPTSYLTGLLAGKKAAKLGVKDIVLDIGFNVSVKGSKVYAAVKGIVDSGFNLNIAEEMLPSEDRISGKHIQTYDSKNSNQFSKYSDKQNLEKQFADTKAKILQV